MKAPYRVDLALKAFQTDPDHVLWFTSAKGKGAFIFRPSEIERIEDLNAHFYPSFSLEQTDDLKKLLGGTTYLFRATKFELRGIMSDVLAARKWVKRK